MKTTRVHLVNHAGVGQPRTEWWWWFGRIACMTCLSIPYSRMHLIRVAGHLGVRLPATPPPPSPPRHQGSNPGPVPVHRALPARGASFMPHEAVDTPNSAVSSTTAPEELARSCTILTSTILSKTNWGISMVRRAVWTLGIGLCTTTGKICTTCATGTSTTECTATGESQWSAEKKSLGDQTLRHDRGVDDLVGEMQLRRAPVVAHNGQTTWKTLHDLHTRNIDHLVQETQLGNLYGQQDLRNEPLRNDTDDDDHLAT